MLIISQKNKLINIKIKWHKLHIINLITHKKSNNLISNKKSKNFNLTPGRRCTQFCLYSFKESKL